MWLFKRKKKNPKEELADLLNGYELPSFPVLVMKALSMLRDPESSMNDIAKVIQQDPGMQVKILRTVNSAAFGLSSKVANVQHAVTMMGRSRLESIILSHVVKDSLPDATIEPFDVKQFWLTAAHRASLARLLASQLHPSMAVESFTAGLLQDMAVPVLIKVKQDQYSPIYNNWHEVDHSGLHLIERENLPYDHMIIGSLMAEQWNLPAQLVTAISKHHEVEEDGIAPAIRLVSYLKDGQTEAAIAGLKKECAEKYNLSTEKVDELLEQSAAAAKEFSDMLQ